MPSKFAEATARSFDPTSIPGLTDKARESVSAVFVAMSTWRNATADNNEKHIKQVVEKMAAAAEALGWPKQIVDAVRAQIESVTEMQTKAMDRVMDAWEEQLKSPNPMTASPSAMLSKLKSLPSFTTSGVWPNADAFQMAATTPMQLWMKSAEQWQK